MHALGARGLERLDHVVADAAVAGGGVDDGLGAALHRGVDRGRVGVAVGIDHGDLGQLVDLVDVPLRLHRVRPCRQAVEQRAAFHHVAERAERRAEGLGLEGVGLGNVAAGVDLVVQHRQRALALGRRVGGDQHGVIEVQRAVGTQCGARAHRADHHHRLVALQRQVEEIRGFLDGVGAVRDHDAVDVRLLEQFRHALGQLEQAFIVEALRADLEDLLALDVGDLGYFRHRGDDLVDRDHGGLVGGGVGRRRAGAGNGAAGANDDDVGLARFGRGSGGGRLGRGRELGVGGAGDQARRQQGSGQRGDAGGMFHGSPRYLYERVARTGSGTTYLMGGMVPSVFSRWLPAAGPVVQGPVQAAAETIREEKFAVEGRRKGYADSA
ncbi:protein of unknown function [Cupriavidus taiwanensis]|uniref:Uncharacterized protein n=1 Tax=Cupriavidus taiwanensis TaxID=164546 RepID=A0A9Q7UTR8_9BURK|nr:protein of unknown function [Cupriavidus taiwanensis]